MIDDRYVDAFGVERNVPESTRAAFATLLALDAASNRLIPYASVVNAQSQAAFDVTLPAQSWTERLSWTIDLENGNFVRGSTELRDAPVVESFGQPDHIVDRRRIRIDAPPLGYHRLTVEAGQYGRAEGALIVVPPAVILPAARPAWGIALQLYTLRSERNWGIGDFTDLAAFIALAAGVGADYVGVNPLHAPHRTNPEAASPYAPTSRTFLNWLYIDADELPEAAHPSVRALRHDPAFARALETLRAISTVDYTGVARVKEIILQQCFAVMREYADEFAGFTKFVAAGGIALERFATFETLVQRFGHVVAAWPAAYRNPATADVEAFALAERRSIEYSMFLQYHAAHQFEVAASAAKAHGIALYRDLAVGVDVNGADVWIHPDAYVPSVSLGCPPDLLNPDGQDWGLPPLDPNGLARDGYQAIAQLFRANMHGAGALRVDHAMSLARLFWSPRGRSALEGAYVAYPFEDVLGVLALESSRTDCCVIGEDLGTVPIGFRERMARACVLSYRILFFERAQNGDFLPAEAYPALSLAATGTHDLALFAAWLTGADIDLRARLGVGDRSRSAQEHAERDVDRERLLTILRRGGDLPADETSGEEIMIAAHRFLARSPARIVMMQVDDAIGETLPVNVPGTADEYPNWRRKLSLNLETIAHDPRFKRLCEALRTARPRAAS